MRALSWWPVSLSTLLKLGCVPFLLVNNTRQEVFCLAALPLFTVTFIVASLRNKTGAFTQRFDNNDRLRSC